MKDQIKNFLNEEQDPKAVEKITAKLTDLLMKNEEIGYIGVQKKPALTVFPDSIVLTNKRIIICKPKNLGLSMDFTDYPWNVVAGAFVKENILGSEFSFSTITDITISIDYIPKTQARKIYTFAKEQMELLKEGSTQTVTSDAIQQPIADILPVIEAPEVIEEVETEEVTDYAQIVDSRSLQVHQSYTQPSPMPEPAEEAVKDGSLSSLSKEELFDKLQNYKKLLDNGLIIQGEYDTLKKEILAHL